MEIFKFISIFLAILLHLTLAKYSEIVEPLTFAGIVVLVSLCDLLYCRKSPVISQFKVLQFVFKTFVMVFAIETVVAFFWPFCEDSLKFLLKTLLSAGDPCDSCTTIIDFLVIYLTFKIFTPKLRCRMSSAIVKARKPQPLKC